MKNDLKTLQDGCVGQSVNSEPLFLHFRLINNINLKLFMGRPEEVFWMRGYVNLTNYSSSHDFHFLNKR